MKIDSVKPNPIITPKTTGYAATVALGASIISGVTKNKTFRRQHKVLAYLSAVLTALHIGLIEYYHHKFKADRK